VFDTVHSPKAEYAIAINAERGFIFGEVGEVGEAILSDDNEADIDTIVVFDEASHKHTRRDARRE